MISNPPGRLAGLVSQIPCVIRGARIIPMGNLCKSVKFVGQKTYSSNICVNL